MTRTGPVRVGLVGAGTISDTYLDNLTSFPDVEVVAVGDLVPEAARSKAERHGVPRSGGAEVVLGAEDVEIVVNLTIPAAHAEVAVAAVAAGQHVWNEKPLTLDRASAQALLADADARGVRVGCAPDTPLGVAQQEARRLVEAGTIGTPLTALVLLQNPGPESWHPNPAFLFAAGAGPLFDLGPYYLTVLGQIFGPVAEIAAAGSQARASRVIGSGVRAGEVFPVSVPTHVSVLARYRSGQSATMIFSFDSAQQRRLLEINGTEGTIAFPDPNQFEGELGIQAAGSEEPEVRVVAPAPSTRGTGVLDMARAIRAGRPHRMSGAQAYHVLDTMIGIEEATRTSAFVGVESGFDRPELLPADWDPRAATL